MPGGALRVGVPLVSFIVVGFTVGDVVGVPVWAVAATADAILIVVLRRAPWRTVPFGAAALAGSQVAIAPVRLGLGVLAAAAAPDLGLQHLFAHKGALAVVGSSRSRSSRPMRSTIFPLF